MKATAAVYVDVCRVPGLLLRHVVPGSNGPASFCV